MSTNRLVRHESLQVFKRFHSTGRQKKHLELLGVPANASEAKIKQAFYKKSLLHHPDKNPGNPKSVKLFAEINEAYQALMLNTREHQSVTNQDFSRRWKFKNDKFRQWHTAAEKSQSAQSTAWKSVHDEDRSVARAAFHSSQESMGGWYGEFYRKQLKEDFQTHKIAREERRRISSLNSVSSDGKCVIM